MSGVLGGSQAARDLAGKVQTVLGPVDPETLGVVLPHEHLFCDLRAYFTEPEETEKKAMAAEPVSLSNLFWVRRQYFANHDNLLLREVDTATREALFFKQAGGGTIVDMSNWGLGRQPQGLVEVAKKTGLNIVMGCGYYIAASHPAAARHMSAEQMAEEMIADILLGVDGSEVRAGVIGEIGCSDPLEPDERKSLEAAACAQRRTGAALNIHPSPFNDRLVHEIVDILGNAGADLARVVVGHCDQWCFSLDTRRKIADAGCYIEHDNLGFGADVEFSFGKWRDLPSDTQRLDDIKTLIDEGYRDRLLISHDICLKHRLRSYGGWGCAHLLENLVPVMRAKGFSDNDLRALMIDNPKRMLTFAETG